MTLTVRPIEQNDVESCGKIGYEAHKAVSAAHGLMTIGPYQESLTPFLPSLAY